MRVNFKLSNVSTVGQKPFVGFIILIGLAAALRLFQIGKENYWIDEAYSVFASNLDPQSILQNTLKDTISPQYYFLLHYWITLFGSSEIATRGFSCLFGLAACGLAYGFANEFLGKRYAITGTAIIALSPYLVWYSQETRVYALLTFYSIGATWLFARTLRQPKSPLNWLGYGIVAALLVIAHYAGGLVLAAHLVTGMVWLKSKIRWQIWAGILIAGAVGLLGAFALVTPVINRIQTNLDYKTSLTPFEIIKKLPGSILDKLTLGVLYPDNTLLKLGGLALFNVLFCIGIASLWKKQRLMAVLLGSCVVIPIVMAMGGSLWLNILEWRFLLPVAVPYYLLVGTGVASLKPKSLRWGTVIFLFTVMALSLVWQSYQPQKPDWRGVAELLTDKVDTNRDLIIYNPGFLDLPLNLYDQPGHLNELGYPVGTFKQKLSFVNTYDQTGAKLTGFLAENKATLEKSQKIWLVQQDDFLDSAVQNYFENKYPSFKSFPFAHVVVFVFETK